MSKKVKRRREGENIQLFCKLMQNLGPEKLAKFDVYQDGIRATARKEYNQELCEYEKKLLNKKFKADEDIVDAISCFISMTRRVEPHTNQRGKDDNPPENENGSHGKDDYVSDSCCDCCSSDEDIELFFSKLKPKGTCYVLEVVTENVPFFITYEGDSRSDEDCGCLDEECEKQPRTKRRKDGSSNDVQSTRGKSRNKVKIEKIENVKCSTRRNVAEPDYQVFLKSWKIVDGYDVLLYGGDKVVYLKSTDGNNCSNNEEKEDHDDGCSSDLEIIDSTMFYKGRNLSPSEMNNDNISKHGSSISESEFRHEVIGILRKPFDQDEFDKLLVEVEQRKPECRHRELRDGNEKSCSTHRDGKSYLDYQPDFGRKLEIYKEDKQKCLNLLRGFIFWLLNPERNGSFKPWKDEECLAINPASL